MRPVVAHLSVIAMLLLCLGCGDETTPDTTPPGKVENLDAAAATDSSMVLTWTAPGDDLATGLASLYDIRYSAAALTDQTWEAAQLVTQLPIPRAAGLEETLIVVDLSSDTDYEFALKTADEVPNWSAMSNVASGHTTDVTPPASVSDLAVDSQSENSIALTWTAVGDDGHSGEGAEYDIRYAPPPITEGAWTQASQATGEPLPATAGSHEAFTVGNLESATLYAFGLKTRDEMPEQWSPLSNVPVVSTLRRITSDDNNDGGAQWSPEGTQIAYRSDRFGEWDIWVTPASGGEAVRLTDAEEEVFDLSWSPDGSQIVFSSGSGNGVDLWVVPSGGGEAARLTDMSGDCVHPAWSPDGSTIAFTWRAAEESIALIPASGGGDPVVLTYGWDPAWSPDGNDIAFTSVDDDYTQDIFVIPYAGGQRIQITSGEGTHRHAVWSPDGARIAFDTTQGTHSDVWWVPSAGGDATQLTFGESGGSPDWSPDGSMIAFSARRGATSSIWVLAAE